MARFEDLYPGVPEGFQYPHPEHEVIALEATRPCWHCEHPTRWCEVNFEAHLCSEECNDAKWKEYFAALRGNDNDGVRERTSPENP